MSYINGGLLALGGDYKLGGGGFDVRSNPNPNLPSCPTPPMSNFHSWPAQPLSPLEGYLEKPWLPRASFHSNFLVFFACTLIQMFPWRLPSAWAGWGTRRKSRRRSPMRSLRSPRRRQRSRAADGEVCGQTHGPPLINKIKHTQTQKVISF